MSTVERKDDFKGETGHVEYTSEAHVPAAVEEEEVELSRSALIRTWLVIFAISILNAAQLYSLLGTSAFARNVSATVGGAASQTWLNQAIAIGTAVFSPIFGRASDLWGRRIFVIVASIAGFVGSIIIGRSSSMGMAIAGSAVTGIAYGAQPLCYAIPAEVMHRKHRNIAQALANASGGVGAIVALLVGGALTRGNNNSKIRIYFYISAGLYGLAAIALFALYRPPPRPSQLEYSTVVKLRSMDWIGYALFGASMTLIAIGLTWAQNPYSWASGHVLGPLIAGIAAAIILAVHQWKFRKDGLFNHRMFSLSRNPAIALLALGIEGCVFFGISNYFPLLLALLWETDSLLVVMRLVIGFVVTLAILPVLAMYSTRFRDVRSVAILGFAGFMAFGIALSQAGLDSAKATWGYSVFIGIGLGSSLVALVTAAQLGSPGDTIAPLTALLIAFRSLGGSIGLGLSTAIYQSKLDVGGSIAAAILPLGFNPQMLGPFIGLLADHNYAALSQLPGVTPQIIAAGDKGFKSAFLHGTKGVWYLVIAFSALGLILSAFINNTKGEYTGKIDAPVEVPSHTPSGKTLEEDHA